MWVDITEHCILWIMLYCGLGYMQGVKGACDSCARNWTHRARPDADVLLPCIFPANAFNWTAHGEPMKVLWTQSSRGTLLVITQTGHVNFGDPRDGRVTVFPYLCRLGNCSIYIKRLQQSDLGEYCCALGSKSICSVLDFSANNGGEPKDVVHSMVDTWFVIGGGAGGVLLVLLIICFCCVKFRKRDDSVPDETNTSVQQDAASNSDEIVYENDEHDPKGIACVEIKPQQVTSNSTGQQLPALKPCYANQQEIDKQFETRKRLKKHTWEYENPIYANSHEQLDQI